MSALNKLAISATLLGCATQLHAAQNDRPNIVLINIDDLGWGDFSFQGSSYYQTPNIDKLKSESIYFSNGYAPAANSAPSRASMMTGHYPQQHGVYTVDPADRGKAEDRKLISAKNSKVPKACYPLIPQTLHDNGYATCHVGKWHLGDNPLRQGFDVNIGGSGAGMTWHYFSPYKMKNMVDGEDGEYLTNRLADEAIKFIDSQSDKKSPFFLYFATYNVHVPLQPEAHILEKYNSKPTTKAHANPKYAAMIESMDRNVGRLLDHIKESRLEGNTLIIFTSDNGGYYPVSKQ